MRLPSLAGLLVAAAAVVTGSAGCMPPESATGRGTLVVTNSAPRDTGSADRVSGHRTGRDRLRGDTRDVQDARDVHGAGGASDGGTLPDEYGSDGVRITRAPRIREVSALDPPRTRLPAPHRRPATRTTTLPATRLGTAPPTRPTLLPPTLRSAHELRLLVGRRDAREPIDVAIEWARQVGVVIDGATVADVIAWGERRSRLADRTAMPRPGDLLVFARTQSDADLDLVAVVIERNARGVTEFVYLAGGVVRRGFVDTARPTLRRDEKLRVVNTFMRHGRRWPPSGTRYLSGELLAHVVRTH